MGNDNSLSILARLDEEKSEKIIRQQLANIQKRLQNQNYIDLGVKVNEETVKQQVQKVNSHLNKTFQEQVISLKLDMNKKNIQSDIDQFMKNNTRMSNELKANFIVLGKTLEKVDDKSALPNINKQLSSLKTEAISTGQIGKNLGDIFKGSLNILTDLKIKDAIIKQVQESIKELKNIDTILTDIGKTGNLTQNQLKQLGNSSYETASAYGKKHPITYPEYKND